MLARGETIHPQRARSPTSPRPAACRSPGRRSSL
jgi:hypothetical protein